MGFLEKGVGRLERMGNESEKEDLVALEVANGDDACIQNALNYIEVENTKNEKIWEDFITNVDEEVEKFNQVLLPYGIKVTTAWDEFEEEEMEWIDFHFRMIDESKTYSYCFMDARNYRNEYFQFNRTSVNADLEMMTETLRQKFNSAKIKELYEGIYRIHQ